MTVQISPETSRRPQRLFGAGALLAIALLAGIGFWRARSAVPVASPDLTAFKLEDLQAQAASTRRPELLSELVRRQLGANKVDAALETARDAVRRFPSSSSTQNALGIVLAQRGEFVEARTQFQKAVGLNAKSVHPYVNLGRLARMAGDDNMALAEYDRATAVDPKSVEAWVGVAESATALHFAGQAREAFDKALELDPNNGPAHAALGCFLAEQESGKDAREHLLRAMELGQKSAKIYASLAMASADLPESKQTLEEALKYADEAEKLGDDSSLLHYARGLARQRLGDYRGAITSFKKVIDQSLTANGAWIGMSQCYRALGERGKADRAARMGERILNERQRLSNLKHQVRSNPNRLEYREQYARELMLRGNFLLAADQYRYLAQHRPDQPREWLKVADAFQKGGQPELAKELRDYVKRQPAGPASASP